MKTTYLTATILFVAVFTSATVAQADIIAGYSFDDGMGNASTVVNETGFGVTASNYGVGAGLNVTNTGGNANGYTGTVDAQGNSFGTNEALSFGSARNAFGFTDMNNNNNLTTAINNNDYMTFTVTAGSGLQLDLDSFTFMSRINSLNHSAERWALFSDIDGFTLGNEIETGRTTTTGSYLGNVVDLSDVAFQGLADPTEFRLYIYGGNNNGSSFTGFDNVILNGTVVPEPASILIWSSLASILGLAMWRRRKS